MRHTERCCRAAAHPSRVQHQNHQFSQAPDGLGRGSRAQGGLIHPREAGNQAVVKVLLPLLSGQEGEQRQRHLHAAKAAQPVCAPNPPGQTRRQGLAAPLQQTLLASERRHHQNPSTQSQQGFTSAQRGKMKVIRQQGDFLCSKSSSTSLQQVPLGQVKLFLVAQPCHH